MQSTLTRTRRVVLHIGLHKTGTTYLQDLFRANRETLAKQGVYYPGGEGEPSPTLAAYDLRGWRAPGARDRRQTGQWDALCRAVAASAHETALISAESLSLLPARSVAEAVAGFPDRRPVVIITCRDLGRVLVSAWQEIIKRDSTDTWAEFIAALRDPAARGSNPARGFWLSHDLPAILATWRTTVPAADIYLVTVPPAGAAPGELVARMATVVDFDPDSLSEPPRRDNASLGVAGTELVRRLNESLGHRLNHRQHRHVVDVLLNSCRVGPQNPRYGLPPEEMQWVEAEARRQIVAVRAAGHPVIGDLDDLLPRLDPSARLPDDVSTDELLAVAMQALTGMSERSAKLWWRQRKSEPPRVAPAGMRVRLASGWRAARFRVRRLGAMLADRNPYAARAAAAFMGQGTGARWQRRIGKSR